MPRSWRSRKQAEHRFRDAADTGLDGGAVGDQAGHLSSDGVVQFGDRVARILAERMRGFHEGIHAADMEERVAERARALVVDLHDGAAGALRGGQGGVDAGPQAHVAVRVGWRALQQADIDGQGAGAKQFLDFAEEDGGVIGAALLYGLAHVAADEEGVVAEVAFVLGQNVVGDPHGCHVQDLDVFQFGPAAGERLHEFHGFGAAVVNVDALAAADLGERHIGGHDARAIIAGHGRLPCSVQTPRRRSGQRSSAPSMPWRAMVKT